MIYELRVYSCLPGRLPALLKRFEGATLKIWEKHGIRQAVQLGEQDLVGRLSPGRADRLPVHLLEGGDVVEAAAADDAEHALGHGVPLSVDRMPRVDRPSPLGHCHMVARPLKCTI